MDACGLGLPPDTLSRMHVKTLVLTEGSSECPAYEAIFLNLNLTSSCHLFSLTKLTLSLSHTAVMWEFILLLSTWLLGLASYTSPPRLLQGPKGPQSPITTNHPKFGSPGKAGGDRYLICSPSFLCSLDPGVCRASRGAGNSHRAGRGPGNSHLLSLSCSAGTVF